MEVLIILFLAVTGGYFYWMFSNRNWQELLTTQNVEKYMKIAGQLQGAGIKYKTTSGGEEFNFRKGTIASQTPPISYTIWVKKDAFYQAEKILHNQGNY